MLATTFYDLSIDDQAERLKLLAVKALRSWPLKVRRIRLVKARENVVFRVESEDGRSYALRVHRYAYHSNASLRSELQWIDALDEAGIEVPVSVPNRNGKSFVVTSINEVPEPRQVDLFRWVDGETLDATRIDFENDAGLTERVFRTIGELAARIHNQSGSWVPPKGFVRHAWDIDGLVGEQPFWGRFWEHESFSVQQAELMRALREQLRIDLGSFGKHPDRYSLIHADLTADNLMFDGKLVRLIDFDDAGFGWHLFEIATSLYFHFSSSYFELARDSLIAGYRSWRPLSEEHLELLPLFLAARGSTYMGWLQTRREKREHASRFPRMSKLACETAERYLGNS